VIRTPGSEDLGGYLSYHVGIRVTWLTVCDCDTREWMSRDIFNRDLDFVVALLLVSVRLTFAR
jgi:hypothetical protein